MGSRRKKYTSEFKKEAVKLVTEQGYPISEMARNLGIKANMLGCWKNWILGEAEGSSGNGNAKPLQSERMAVLSKRSCLTSTCLLFC